MGCLDSNPGFGFAVRCAREGVWRWAWGCGASGADDDDDGDQGLRPHWLGAKVGDS